MTPKLTTRFCWNTGWDPSKPKLKAICLGFTVLLSRHLNKSIAKGQKLLAKVPALSKMQPSSYSAAPGQRSRWSRRSSKSQRSREPNRSSCGWLITHRSCQINFWSIPNFWRIFTRTCPSLLRRLMNVTWRGWWTYMIQRKSGMRKPRLELMKTKNWWCVLISVPWSFLPSGDEIDFRKFDFDEPSPVQTLWLPPEASATGILGGGNNTRSRRPKGKAKSKAAAAK